MMGELRPNAQRAKAAIALIWVILAMKIMEVIASFLQLWIYTSLRNGEFVSETIQIAATFLQGISLLLCFGAYIVSIVFFIRWFRRAYYNLGVKTGATEYGEGWAAGAWFVPIMNLFAPYKIMKEIYEKTDQYLLFEANEPYVNRLKKSNLTLWWTLWIINGFFGNIVARVTSNAETISELINGEILSIINAAIFVPLCIVTVSMIKNYSEAEDLFNEVNQD